jgi:hypothetical protein
MRMRSAICHQFREDAVDGVGVHERYLETEKPRVRLGVDQVHAGRAEPRELGPHVVDPIGDVVHARTAPGQEPAHRGVVAERLDQLDPAVADTNGCRIDPLVVDTRTVLELGAEQGEVRVQRSVEVGDGEPDVVNGPRRHEGGTLAAHHRDAPETARLRRRSIRMGNVPFPPRAPPSGPTSHATSRGVATASKLAFAVEVMAQCPAELVCSNLEMLLGVGRVGLAHLFENVRRVRSAARASLSRSVFV